jgi:hypothetical protein
MVNTELAPENCTYIEICGKRFGILHNSQNANLMVVSDAEGYMIAGIATRPVGQIIGVGGSHCLASFF